MSLPLTDIVDYDLANYKMELNKDFNVEHFLSKSGLDVFSSQADDLLVQFTSNLSKAVKT